MKLPYCERSEKLLTTKEDCVEKKCRWLSYLDETEVNATLYRILYNPKRCDFKASSP